MKCINTVNRKGDIQKIDQKLDAKIVPVLKFDQCNMIVISHEFSEVIEVLNGTRIAILK